MLGSGVYLHFQGKQLQYFHFCLPSPRRELHVFPFKSTPHPLPKFPKGDNFCDFLFAYLGA